MCRYVAVVHGDQLLPAEVSQLISQKNIDILKNFREIRYFTYLTQKEGSLFTDNRKGLRCQNILFAIKWSSIGQTGFNFEFIQPSEHSEPHTSFCH